MLGETRGKKKEKTEPRPFFSEYSQWQPSLRRHPLFYFVASCRSSGFSGFSASETDMIKKLEDQPQAMLPRSNHQRTNSLPG